jgi:hypothetical protein
VGYFSDINVNIPYNILIFLNSCLNHLAVPDPFSGLRVSRCDQDLGSKEPIIGLGSLVYYQVDIDSSKSRKGLMKVLP